MGFSSPNSGVPLGSSALLFTPRAVTSAGWHLTHIALLPWKGLVTDPLIFLQNTSLHPAGQEQDAHGPVACPRPAFPLPARDILTILPLVLGLSITPSAGTSRAGPGEALFLSRLWGHGRCPTLPTSFEKKKKKKTKHWMVTASEMPCAGSVSPRPSSSGGADGDFPLHVW